MIAVRDSKMSGRQLWVSKEADRAAEQYQPASNAHELAEEVGHLLREHG
jgi:hypothetical protein